MLNPRQFPPLDPEAEDVMGALGGKPIRPSAASMSHREIHDHMWVHHIDHFPEAAVDSAHATQLLRQAHKYALHDDHTHA